MTPAESMKNEDPPLTAADLDRLAALHEAATPGPLTCDEDEWGDYVFCVPRGNIPIFESRGTGANLPQAANRRYLCALWNALPSLLALARRGLEAERFPAHCAFCGARSEATPRAAAEHIATCDKHPLRAAVEENALLRAEIARGLGTRCDAPDCALQPLVGLCWDHAVSPGMPLAAGESKLAAALAEVERVRGLLDGAHQFVTMGALTHPNPTVQAEASLWLDRCAVVMGWNTAAPKGGPA